MINKPRWTWGVFRVAHFGFAVPRYVRERGFSWPQPSNREAGGTLYYIFAGEVLDPGPELSR